MAKVTSKLQVTIPKALADQLHLSPGDEIEWELAGSSLLVLTKRRELSAQQRLDLFDAATARQAEQQRGRTRGGASERGWTREELYRRGRPD